MSLLSMSIREQARAAAWDHSSGRRGEGVDGPPELLCEHCPTPTARGPVSVEPPGLRLRGALRQRDNQNSCRLGPPQPSHQVPADSHLLLSRALLAPAPPCLASLPQPRPRPLFWVRLDSLPEWLALPSGQGKKRGIKALGVERGTCRSPSVQGSLHGSPGGPGGSTQAPSIHPGVPAGSRPLLP